MLRRILAAVALLLFLGASGLGAAYVLRFELLRWRQDLPAYTHAPGSQTHHRVAMRDGIHLATTVRLPAGGSRWPAVLIRNPYPRFDRIAKDVWCGVLVRYGYGCVYQDARGQMESEGEWEPLVHEREDGLDTLDWLVARPFQDGNLALYGPSYLGAVQWAVADALPPAVKTLIPLVIATDFRRALYQRGMFRHETFTAWAALMRDGRMQRGAGERYRQALRHFPHRDVDTRFFQAELPWYRQWLDSASPSAPLWQEDGFRRLREAPARTRVPVLMIGGWYDVFLGPQIDDFQALASRGRSKLVIGPWTHGGGVSGVLDFPGADGGSTQWPRVLDWLGHHLRGEPLAQAPNGVETYVMGGNRWVTRPAWPPATRPVRLHLLAPAAGEGCRAGLLSATPAAAGRTLTYRYDPRQPTPTLGGGGMLAFLLPGFRGAAPAAQWQRAPCARPDVMSFLSEPLPTKLHVAGPFEVSLRASSDAPDTAFHAKLIEVFDDGRAVNVRDAITSLAHRDGASQPAPYVPGEAVTVPIRSWPVEWVFAAGSRLRLDVASADFPKFHAHPNRAGPWADVTAPQAAQQTLHLGGGDAWLEIPAVEASP